MSIYFTNEFISEKTRKQIITQIFLILLQIVITTSLILFIFFVFLFQNT